MKIIHKKVRTNFARPPFKAKCGKKIFILGSNYHYHWKKITCKRCLAKCIKKVIQ
jgi:hypothetical protein